MNETFTALIVDDEEPARMIIRDYLSDFPEIKILAECTNGFEGVRQIQELKPDLLFLDVQMPKLNGFELLEVIDENPVVIFSTAYDQYALQAFEQNAVDYLLKPYSRDRFHQAVKKALQKAVAGESRTGKPERILVTATPESPFIDRLVVKTGTRIKVVPVEQISCFEAGDDYVSLYTAEGRFLKQITMNWIENQLNPKEFVRIHRSYIVRIDQIVQLEPYDKETKVVVMKSGQKIHTSKTGFKRLREVLGF